MIYLGYLMQAWLIFITPLLYMGHRPSVKKQTIFTITYTLGIVLFRRLYDIISIPFGTHMILLVILHMILLLVLIKEINWIESICMALISMIIMMANDLLIVLPIMHYFNLSLDISQANGIMQFSGPAILSNLLIIVLYTIITLRRKTRNKGIYR